MADRSRKTLYQVTVNLILAYLADIRLSSGPFEPVFLFRDVLRRNARHFSPFGMIWTGISLSF